MMLVAILAIATCFSSLICVRAQGISTTPVLAQVNYIAAPTEIVQFLPIEVPSAIIRSGSGFANQHVTMFEAHVYVGGTEASNLEGRVTMQTQRDGKYSLVFASMATYGPGEEDEVLATTWISCSGPPDGSVRTCASSGEKITGTTATSTYTYSVSDGEEAFTTTVEDGMTATTRISSSLVVTLEDSVMATLTMDKFLRRRTATTQQPSRTND
jgi:cytochrome c biogenesis protein CcdA